VAERKAYIHGAGGHAHVIASLLDRQPTFVVPQPQGPDQMRDVDFFDRIDDFRGCDIYIGIGDGADRKRIFERHRSLGVKVATCVAPNTFVARDAVLGEGVLICPGSVVNTRAVLGDNTIVNTLSSVDHDCFLGSHSQVTAGVTFGGWVRVGESCFFGVKSAVVPRVTIGNNVVVMAGALVTQSLPDGVLAGGSPARALRQI
jgi:sugar O-acyltransferase (sialic acid O-acetyltransferase NeuD family)